MIIEFNSQIDPWTSMNKKLDYPTMVLFANFRVCCGTFYRHEMLKWGFLKWGSGKMALFAVWKILSLMLSQFLAYGFPTQSPSSLATNTTYFPHSNPNQLRFTHAVNFNKAFYEPSTKSHHPSEKGIFGPQVLVSHVGTHFKALLKFQYKKWQNGC